MGVHKVFYEFERGRVGFLTLEELKDDYVMYGFPIETVQECEKHLYNFRSHPILKEDLIFVVIDYIQLHDVFGEQGRVAIYFQSDLCLVINVKDVFGMMKERFDAIMNRYKTRKQGLAGLTIETFLYHFLDDLMIEDRTFLENMEIQMSGLETRMLSERVNPTFVNEILSLKKEFMYIRNYYEQLMDVGEVFRDNENDILSSDQIQLFEIFVNRVKRVCDNVKDLKEYTVQLQETHDAMLDYDLNRIMKLFTVVTAVFAPLSLIVGWYGMNFESMPEFAWKYGYLYVVGCTIGVLVVCFVLFRKYRLLS